MIAFSVSINAHPWSVPYITGRKGNAKAIKNAELEAFQAELILKTKKYFPYPLEGRLEVYYWITRYIKDKRSIADDENLSKAITDGLVKAGMCKNDRQIKHREITVVAQSPVVEPLIEIVIREI